MLSIYLCMYVSIYIIISICISIYLSTYIPNNLYIVHNIAAISIMANWMLLLKDKYIWKIPIFLFPAKKNFLKYKVIELKSPNPHKLYDTYSQIFFYKQKSNREKNKIIS